MKTLWIIANWKSNKTLPQTLEWLSSVGPKIHPPENIKVVVCPDFLALEEVKKEIQVNGYKLLVGAQDLSPFPEGPYTGEESAPALSGFADLVILGHSERRQNFSETDEMVEKKVEQANKNNILALVCVQGKETPVPESTKIVAYEPVFAIGSGEPDTPANAESVASEFAQRLNIPVLYGGSVTSENAKAFVSQENIAGLLIGTASLDAEEFLKIIDVCSA